MIRNAINGIANPVTYNKKNRRTSRNMILDLNLPIVAKIAKINIKLNAYKKRDIERG
jgi:hypothetical protein